MKAKKINHQLPPTISKEALGLAGLKLDNLLMEYNIASEEHKEIYNQYKSSVCRKNSAMSQIWYAIRDFESSGIIPKGITFEFKNANRKHKMLCDMLERINKLEKRND